MTMVAINKRGKLTSNFSKLLIVWEMTRLLLRFAFIGLKCKMKLPFCPENFVGLHLELKTAVILLSTFVMKEYE